MYVYAEPIRLKIILNVGVNIEAATTRQIKYRKPDGTSGYFTATEESSTSISYTTVAITDLNLKGNWKLQSYIITPTWTNHGDIIRLTVKEHL